MPNELVFTSRMSSIDLAKMAGIKHKNLLCSAREMEAGWLSQGGLNFQPATYIDKQGKSRPCYMFTKDQSLFVATRFRNDIRAKLVMRWEELERAAHHVPCDTSHDITVPEPAAPAFQLPTTFSQALYLAAKQAEELEQQQRLIAEQSVTIEHNNEQIASLQNEVSDLSRKVSYLDIILSCTDTILVTAIAQDYGYSAISFNKLLHDVGVQHRVGDQWILYAKYVSEGYAKTVTYTFAGSNGQTKTKLNTQWTQKGREWLYYHLKKRGIIPLIEQQELF